MTFGILLLEERTGERVSAMAHKHMHNSEQTCLEILREWFAGRGKQPVTWKTLIEVLHDIELCTLAREIAAVKLSGDKDRPTEVTEVSNRRTEDRTQANEDSNPQRDGEEIPTGSIEDLFNSEESVRAKVNTNPELGLHITDTNDSELLEQEQKFQANDASGEIGRKANNAFGEIKRWDWRDRNEHGPH